jgi:phosphoribosylformylglycinamidine cyclo-ligase
MVAIIDPSVSDLAIRSLAARGMKSWIAGEVKKSNENIGSSLINNYTK